MSAGIYIHVPFCLSKCSHCDFYSVVGDEAEVNLYYEALLGHIDIVARTKWRNRIYNTIYFGGGTPSLLGAEIIGEIITAIRRNFSLTPTTEITIEMNPDTVTLSLLTGLKKYGVNRLSIGGQSYDDNQLKTLGRIHNTEAIDKAIDDANQAGFMNINLDLIFGIPGQTVESWKYTLSRTVDKNPMHISAYGLTIENGTPIQTMIRSSELKPVDDDTQAEMYSVMQDILTGNGYRRYEVSNYAKPGFECLHNLKYWTDRKYLGLGPSAHSYYTSYRKSSHRDLNKYAAAIQKGKLPTAFKEELTTEQKSEERLMMGLRLAEGIELHSVKDVINTDTMNEFIGKGYLQKDLNMIALTDKGFLIADEIIVKLLRG